MDVLRISTSMCARGRFRAEVHTGHFYENGKLVRLADPIRQTSFGKNVITLSGIAKLLNDDVPIKMQAGDDNTTPAESDTQLGNLLGSTTTHVSTNTNRNTTPDGDGNVTWTATYRYTFNPGALGSVPVNVAEAGVRSNDIDNVLVSHGLLVDDTDTPTTVSVDPTFEYLDLIWELTFYVPASVTGTSTFSILGVDTSTDWEVRPAFFGNTGGSYNFKGWADASAGLVPGFSIIWTSLTYDGTNAATQVRSTNGLGALTSSPANDSGLTNAQRVPTSAIRNAYVTDSKERTMKLVWLPDRANIPGGIQSVLVNCVFSQWQISYSPKLSKTSDYQLNLEFKLTLHNK